MNRFFAAIGFLTILPLPKKWETRAQCPRALQESAAFFPLVGLLAGVGLWLLILLLPLGFPQPVTGWILALIMVAASGGLHVDGLADTADGFLSSRPKERILEIMRDSRIGTMGALAVVGVLGLKATAWGFMSADWLKPAAFFAPIAGRCAMTMMMTSLPYVRLEGGRGSIFSRRPSIGWWAGAVLLLTGWVAAGGKGLVVVSMVLAVTIVLGWRAYRKIGGVTGDVLGASCELAETAAVVAFCFFS